MPEPSQPPGPELSEDALIARVEALLADPAHADNPLRDALSGLYRHSEQQRGRLERLVRISDGYHLLERASNESLAQRYDKQLRRIEKIARISDRYQNSLREMSEALKEAALRDPLTGLGNRRFLIERIKEENQRCARGGGGYTLALGDVDRFKMINDRYGHEIGDQTLCEIAACIRRALREYDLCGRWGGEEFLIVLPETRITDAAQVVERVRAEIERIALPTVREPLAVTASFGLTEYRSGENLSDTVNRADVALYRAKAAGRNRIDSV